MECKIQQITEYNKRNKQAHRYTEQISGCQWEEVGEEAIQRRGLRHKLLCIK